MLKYDRFIKKRPREEFKKNYFDYKNLFKINNYRYISNSAEQILDAPQLNCSENNFIIDWSNTNNILAIVLGEYIYFWNQRIIDNIYPNYLNKSKTKSLKLNKSGIILAYANENELFIYNIENKKILDILD